VFEPKSIAFHKHHASMAEFGAFKESYFLERNALFSLYKNLEAENLAEALPAALALTVRRAVAKGKLDSASFDLRTPGGDTEPTLSVSKDALSGVFGIDQFVSSLPGLRRDRDKIQASRVVSDARLWRLFGLTDMPANQDDYYLEGYEKIVSAFDVIEPPVSNRVLIVTGDPIGKKLAGPAIRAWNMAETLSRTNSVTLVTLSGAEEIAAPFDIVHVNPGADREFSKLEKWADVIIFQGHAMAVFNSLRTSKKILVVDIYDPMHLEQLEQGKELAPDIWSKQVSDATDVLNEQLARGDFFLCASERQRHFYLGQLAALGRINPANYVGDPDLDGLISVVPFGLSSIPPRHVRPVLKGVLPGIGKKDKVLLWSGGLYNWFDPGTLIRAVAQLSQSHKEIRLFFQGTKHPHPGVPEMAIVSESRALASELDVLGTNVFFNSSWVDYADRENYLTEADAGVSTHYAHVETTFSFRTRILDYLWGELPMVVTAGDHFAELVATEGLGVVVEAEDVDALAAALEKVLFDTAFIAKAKANIKRVRETYYWDRVLTPLVEFIEAPHSAGDRVGSTPASNDQIDRPRQRRKRSGFRHDIGLVSYYLRNGGPSVVIDKVKRRLGRARS
jgi:glycosyltransferase involved in cell wall biosynthesis